MNIVDSICRENRNRLNHVAVVEPEREWTYGQLLREVADLCRLLTDDIGIEAGSRIAFRCEDGAAHIIGSLALLEAGAAIVPIDVSMAAQESKNTMERIDVNGVLFLPGSFHENAGDRLFETIHSDIRFCWRPREVTEIGQKLKACNALSPAFIRFSSGTTGANKGVVLSHSSIHERTDAANEGLQISEKDRILWVLQMSHHFVVSILLFLRKGAAIVIAHRDFPMSIIDLAGEETITFIYATPFHYHLLATTPAIEATALCNVRLALSTAMKLPEETAVIFAEKFNFDLAEAYGIIEVGLPFINLRPSPSSRGSVGQLLPAYELKLENPDSEGVGHVLIRGQGMFDAYFSPWQLRVEALDDGWFRTGDLGRLGDSKNLYIVGREKSVIICAGMKVFPLEVEQVLNAHAGVHESLVYGADHPVYGETPEAKIVAANPARNLAELQEALRRHCYAELAPYKVPKSFTLVPSLPRTVSGKLKRL